MIKGNHIILLGFMGAGKTTLGKYMAKKSNKSFLDLDQFIVDQEGMSISDLVSLRGWTYFRQLETEALKVALNSENMILALGGGTPLSDENWELIESKGLSFYLKVEPEILLERLIPELATRPLLKGMSPNELSNFIHSELEKRILWYQKADFTIEATESPEVIEAQIERLIQILSVSNMKKEI